MFDFLAVRILQFSLKYAIIKILDGKFIIIFFQSGYQKKKREDKETKNL